MAVAVPVVRNALAVGTAVVPVGAADVAAVEFVLASGTVFLSVAAPEERSASTASAGELVGRAGLPSAVRFIGEVTAVVIAVAVICLADAMAISAGEVIRGAGGSVASLLVRVVRAVLATITPVDGGDANSSAGQLVRAAGPTFDTAGDVVRIESHSGGTEAGSAGSENRETCVRAATVVDAARTRLKWWHQGGEEYPP